MGMCCERRHWLVEEKVVQKDWIRIVGGWMFLLVPSHPGSLEQMAIKRLLLLTESNDCSMSQAATCVWLLVIQEYKMETLFVQTISRQSYMARWILLLLMTLGDLLNISVNNVMTVWFVFTLLSCCDGWTDQAYLWNCWYTWSILHCVLRSQNPFKL